MTEPQGTTEQILLVTRESKRSYLPWRAIGAVLLLGLPFLGRQRITVTNERIVIEQGFLTKVRDDVEIFRLRDVVSSRNLLQQVLGIGHVKLKAAEGRAEEEIHVLRGVPDPVGVSEVIRNAWNRAGRPRTSTNIDG